MAHAAADGWRAPRDQRNAGRAHGAGGRLHGRPARARDVLLGVKERIGRHRLTIVAAGVAFYALLAIFPALGALISIYGLVADPAQIAEQISSMAGLLPQQALDIVLKQLNSLTQSGGSALGLGALIGILLALWSASAGVKALMEALNVAYEEEEERGFVKRAAVGLALTLGAIIAVAVAIALVVVLPAVIEFIGLQSETLEGVAAYARWPVLALIAIFAIGMLYRYGPSRERPRWTWLNLGAVVATILWIAGSALFSWYVTNFGKYNETYGAVSAIVILLMWFLLSAYAVLLGAEINAERLKPASEEPVSSR